jgi:hypothetical protein
LGAGFAQPSVEENQNNRQGINLEHRSRRIEVSVTLFALFEKEMELLQ